MRGIRVPNELSKALIYLYFETIKLMFRYAVGEGAAQANINRESTDISVL